MGGGKRTTRIARSNGELARQHGGAPPRRRGGAIAACSLILAALLAAGWLRSCFFTDILEYRSGALAPLTIAQGTSDDWQYNVQARSASQMNGVIYLRSSTYVSFGVPREQLLEQWQDWHGLHFTGLRLDAPPRSDGETLYYRDPLDWRCAGFGVFSTFRQGEEARVVSVPHWFLLLIALTPIFRRRWLMRRDRQRWESGRCVRCGYDLRGSVHAAGQQARCPECGSTVTAA